MPNTNPPQTPPHAAPTGSEGGATKVPKKEPPTTERTEGKASERTESGKASERAESGKASERAESKAQPSVADKAAMESEGGATKVPKKEPPTTERMESEARPSIADKLSPENLQQAAQSAFSGAKEALVEAKDETAARLDQARDAAVESYRSARERARDVAREVDDRTRRARRQLAAEMREMMNATGGFVRAHALPLTLVGVGLGWLAVSMRRESRRAFDVEVSPRQEADLAPSRPGERPRARPPQRSRSWEERPEAHPAAMTTSGAKLMGVRAREPGLDR